MNKLTLSATAAIAALSIALPAEARTTRERCTVVNQAQVEGLFNDFNAAWATKDPAKVTSLFSRDAVLLATVSNTPRTTPEAVNDYFVSFLKGSPVGTINSSTVTLGCNTASRVGTWTVALTNAQTGAVTNVRARYSFIYKIENGQWKIQHLHSSMMPEPTS